VSFNSVAFHRPAAILASKPHCQTWLVDRRQKRLTERANVLAASVAAESDAIDAADDDDRCGAVASPFPPPRWLGGLARTRARLYYKGMTLTRMGKRTAGAEEFKELYKRFPNNDLARQACSQLQSMGLRCASTGAAASKSGVRRKG
jgi:hypothetical protein